MGCGFRVGINAQWIVKNYRRCAFLNNAILNINT